MENNEAGGESWFCENRLEQEFYFLTALTVSDRDVWNNLHLTFRPQA